MEKPSSENPKELDSEMELIQDSNQNMSPVRKKQVDLDTKSEDEPIKLKVWFISRFLKSKQGRPPRDSEKGAVRCG